MGMQVVDSLLAEVEHEVEGLSAVARASILPVLAQARQETAQGLSDWLKSVPDGAERFTAHQYRRALAQLDRALTAVDRLGPALTEGLVKADRRAGPLAFQHVARELQVFAGHFKGSVTMLPIHEAVALREGSKTLIKRFATSAARYAGDVGNDIRRELAVGMLKGESIFQMTNRLQRHGGPRGEVALRGIAGQPRALTEYIAEGLFAKYRHWGERVAVTETVAAYNYHAEEGIAEAHRLDDRIQRMWSAAFDKRTCPICEGLDGTVASVGGKFPGGYDLPPSHPRCRCCCVAWRSDWAADTKPAPRLTAADKKQAASNAGLRSSIAKLGAKARASAKT